MNGLTAAKTLTPPPFHSPITTNLQSIYRTLFVILKMMYPESPLEICFLSQN